MSCGRMGRMGRGLRRRACQHDYFQDHDKRSQWRGDAGSPVHLATSTAEPLPPLTCRHLPSITYPHGRTQWLTFSTTAVKILNHGNPGNPGGTQNRTTGASFNRGFEIIADRGDGAIRVQRPARKSTSFWADFRGPLSSCRSPQAALLKVISPQR